MLSFWILQFITSWYFMRKILIGLISLSVASLSSCATLDNMFGSNQSSATQHTASVSPNNEAFWKSNSGLVWNRLQTMPPKELQSMLARDTNNSEASGWVKLALISKQYSTRSPELIRELQTWRQNYPNHPGNQLFPANATLSSITTNPPKHIALLLPLQGPYAGQGKTIRDGFMRAYYARAKTMPRQTLSFIDTSQNPDIAALYQQAVSKGADFVIGPLTKNDVQMIQRMGNFPAQTLALNYSDSESLPTNFYEFGLSPLDETKQLADKASQAGHRRAILIAPRNDWGQRISKSLTAQWQNNGGAVVDVFYFSEDTNFSQAIPDLLHINAKADREMMKKENDKNMLAKQRRQDFDVIFLLAQPKEARQIVPLLKYYYAGNVPIYATSTVYAGISNPQRDVDLNGVIFCDIPSLIKSKNGKGNRLFAVGYDSYMLSHEMPRLIAIQNFPVYGATGALTLTSQHKIYRRLPWTQIQEGHI